MLAEGVELLREIAAQPGMRRLLGRELVPGPDVSGPSLARTPARTSTTTGTRSARAGWAPPATRERSSTRGQVHGVEGCYVADCSVIPFVPRATTMLPAVVVAERVAELSPRPHHQRAGHAAVITSTPSSLTMTTSS